MSLLTKTGSNINDGLLVSVSGYRNYNNYDGIKEVLDQYHIRKIHVGDCRGVDRLIVRYCKEKNIECRIFYADWKLGRGGGLVRNEELIDGTELLIAFPSSDSRGTRNAINIAKKMEICVHVYDV